MSVTLLDRKVYLICYYASKGNVSEKSTRGQAINSMLQQYQNYLLYGKNKQDVEKSVSKLYVERPKEKTFKPLLEREKIQVGAGVSNGNPNGEGLEKQREQLLKKAVDDTVDEANDVSKQNQFIIKQMEAMTVKFEERLAPLQKSHVEIMEFLQSSFKQADHDIGTVEKLSKKNLEETLKSDPNYRDLKSWFVGTLTSAFKAIFLTVPWKFISGGFNIVKTVVYTVTIYPLEVVVKFYRKKIGFVAGHIFVVVVAGIVYYIYLHASEDERVEEMCKKDPTTFMCSKEERMFVYHAYSTTIPIVEYVGEKLADVYSVTFHIAGDGMSLMYQDMKNTAATYMGSASQYAMSQIPLIGRFF